MWPRLRFCFHPLQYRLNWIILIEQIDNDLQRLRLPHDGIRHSLTPLRFARRYGLLLFWRHGLRLRSQLVRMVWWERRVWIDGRATAPSLLSDRWLEESRNLGRREKAWEAGRGGFGMRSRRYRATSNHVTGSSAFGWLSISSDTRKSSVETATWTPTRVALMVQMKGFVSGWCVDKVCTESSGHFRAEFFYRECVWGVKQGHKVILRTLSSRQVCLRWASPLPSQGSQQHSSLAKRSILP